MRKIPKYSELQIRVVLDSTSTLPGSIGEVVYENELKNNPNLKWKINPFLSRKKSLELLLDPSGLKKWLLLKKLNWLIALFIVVYALLSNDYSLLWTLFIIPLFTASGLLDHWIMIFNLAVLLVLKFFIKFNADFFWFIIGIVLATYILSRLAQEFLEKSILKIAFSDADTFWKFYSNRLIYIDETKTNDEFENLMARYPELTN